MAAPNQPYSYRDDVPQEIVEKIHLHKLQKQQIDDLEIQLKELRQSHATLDVELEPYRIGTSSIQQNADALHGNGIIGGESAIERCPNEILILIFRMCLSAEERYHHQDIAMLVRVCKHWNRLIMNTPPLWARIELPGNVEWDDILHRKLLHPYISACMDRSKDIPIEIDLTFGMFPGFGEWMTAVSSMALRPLTDPNDHDTIVDAMDQIDWYQFQSTIYDKEVKEFSEFLTGDGGAHIQRWRSLSVETSVFIKPLMDIFAKFPPKLTTLKIFSPTVGYFGDEDLTGFGDLSLVENFIIPSPTPISNFGVSPTVLQQLDILIDGTYFNLKELSQFSALQALTIRSHAWPEDGHYSFTITLSHLHTLRIFDGYQGLSSLTWNIPVLKYLFISDWHPEYKIPRISAYHIKLELQKSRGLSITKSQMAEGLDSILSLSPNIQTLTVDPSLSKVAVQMIERHRADGKLASLHKVVVQGQQAKEEIFMHDRNKSQD